MSEAFLSTVPDSALSDDEAKKYEADQLMLLQLPSSDTSQPLASDE